MRLKSRAQPDKEEEVSLIPAVFRPSSVTHSAQSAATAATSGAAAGTATSTAQNSGQEAERQVLHSLSYACRANG